MRGLIVGAVEGTRVAARKIASATDWTLAGIMTLPPEKAGRHSDYVDLSDVARETGARLIHAQDSNSDDACTALAECAPDFTFVIGWSQICRPNFRAAARDRVIGYHPAPLPRLRGRAALPWTILLDEKISGSTLFWIDDGVDSGDILAQQFFHVAPRETAASLYAKHMDALEGILDMALSSLAAGEEPRTKQDDTFATYAAKRTPADGLIDWNWSADRIDRLVRAVGRPYPGAFTTFKDRTITIFGSNISAIPNLHAMPGQIVARASDEFAVMCGDGRVLTVTDFTISEDQPLPLQHAVLGRST
ncbi:formyltransferase family protein [Qipengyuania zhejiangensis]|uniref:formyltransferase family protein n=1 Tax=Qipengyuania zhejiangensis TaxID=3077782 RepID=UPI002D784BC2|nr:formyltransferase family protein [Qipengyuania sp. Z2]